MSAGDTNSTKVNGPGNAEVLAIFHGAPDAIIVMNEEGNIINWNPIAETLFGWKQEEVTGKPLNEVIIPAAYREAHREGLKRFLATGKGTLIGENIDVKALKKNNEEVDISLKISQVKIEGKFVFVGFMRDITERIKKDIEVNQSRELFSTLFYKSPSMNVLTDEATGKYLDVNDSFAGFCGIPKEEIIGKTSAELGIIADLEERARLLQEVSQHKSVKDWSLLLKMKDGRERWVSVNADSLTIMNKPCLLSTMSDITTLKKGEEKFRNLLEAAPDAVVIVDKRGIIKLVNVQTELLFEYKREELLEQQLEILIPERYRKEHPHYRNDFFKTPRTRGMGVGLELYGLKKSGIEFPVEISLSPLETEDGMLVSAAIRDITERKESEKKLRSIEEQYRLMIDEVDDYAIILLDKNGIIRNWNKGAEKIKGYKAEEIIGQNFQIFYTSEDKIAGLPQKLIDTAMQNGKAIDEGWRIRKDGTTFWGSIVIVALRDEKRNIIGFTKITRDITEKREMEKQIQQANASLERKVRQRTDELERKNKDLEQFAYVASHDLQEPLRTTSSFVEMFRNKYQGRLDEDADTMLKYIFQSSERMKVLIKDLLDYSRIGRKTEIGEVDCNKLIEDVTADLAIIIRETDTKITMEKLPLIRGYATELKLLFQNLVSNSIKFRKKDTMPLVHIGVEKKKDHWQFFVADNGIGIDEKHAERIFVIFQRLHTRTEYEGSGIGLSHCKKIAELHGGKIWVKSEPGKGSIFYFTISEM